MMLHSDHVCDIAEDEGDILFLPGKWPHQKLYDFLRTSLLASRKNPAAYKYLRSTASIINEKRRHWRGYAHVIHPFSMFRHCWDFLMVFVISSLLMVVPYQATFEVVNKSKMWNISKNTLLTICCLDVLVNLRTGYFDRELHAVVLEQRKIARRYIRSSTFFLDVIGSFPTDLIYTSRYVEYMMARKATSILCMLRVFSLNSYIHKLAFAYDIPLVLRQIGPIFFWTVLLLHWQSCFHWLVPLVTTSMCLPERPSNNSWVHVDNLWEKSKARQYLASTLRAIATFTRANLVYTDHNNAADVWLTIVLQLFGMVAPWVLLTRVMQFFKGANSSRLRYQGTVAQLRQYMRHKQLPYPTQKRIIQYYEFRFQRRFFRESEIIHTLSLQMRHEIGMHSCRKLVENVTFFNNLPLTLLGRIVGLLRSEIFLTNDVIVRANQPGDCMYFIGTGTVAIYTTSGKEVCHLEDGAHFGEVALVMPNELRVASVVAVEMCELYRLNRIDFARTIHPYPMLWETIKKIAIERHEKTMILNEQ